jgi:hypothetical protein
MKALMGQKNKTKNKSDLGGENLEKNNSKLKNFL